ncbi:hypothetical protein UA75_30405 [Actinoalloteichus sp. GBA129-24]|uniref:Uncharacterized protein n=1 Tax=Actinoalloteichus fjordicus TaxID=1612552 RepID=A0AAC9LKK9_9PSEU|nr:hypothetical protein UA74_29870 [Actinoalloteichus fjordicus]APU24044.1 hypothetical protein UA75_30405 [Actinoalloteichus sp. GBA129-24]
MFTIYRPDEDTEPAVASGPARHHAARRRLLGDPAVDGQSSVRTPPTDLGSQAEVSAGSEPQATLRRSVYCPRPWRNVAMDSATIRNHDNRHSTRPEAQSGSTSTAYSARAMRSSGTSLLIFTTHCSRGDWADDLGSGRTTTAAGRDEPADDGGLAGPPAVESPTCRRFDGRGLRKRQARSTSRSDPMVSRTRRRTGTSPAAPIAAHRAHSPCGVATVPHVSRRPTSDRRAPHRSLPWPARG